MQRFENWAKVITQSTQAVTGGRVSYTAIERVGFSVLYIPQHSL
jgi:hypothetical protein